VKRKNNDTDEQRKKAAPCVKESLKKNIFGDASRAAPGVGLSSWFECNNINL
jgi:hypothetical protein